MARPNRQPQRSNLFLRFQKCCLGKHGISSKYCFRKICAQKILDFPNVSSLRIIEHEMGVTARSEMGEEVL